jgi:hypothetical protein
MMFWDDFERHVVSEIDAFASAVNF